MLVQPRHVYHVFARVNVLNNYTHGIRYMDFLNPADLRLITFEMLIFVFPSIMNFWDKRMFGINSKNLHIP